MQNPEILHTEDGEYVFSVSELNLSAKAVLETHFQTILVAGEVSNFSRPASGHIYFSLKDQNAQVRCAWFRGRQAPLAFDLENGLSVIVLADVTLYPEKGEYQLVIRKVQLAGAGLMKQKLEALKRKLAAEGLFDPEHKKPLPLYPKTIGVITSSSGAALQDVLTVLKRRAPFIAIRVYPCQVQGHRAPESIVAALNQAILERKADVLLLTRGGGSNEDLSAFNNERLAYALFHCPIPTVSAVGHEIDLSITDFIADFRAPTPSAAAECMSPNCSDLLALLYEQRAQLDKTLLKHIDEKIKHLAFFSRLIVHPAKKLYAQQELLTQNLEKLNKIIHNRIVEQKKQVDFIGALLQKNNPQQKIVSLSKRLSQAHQFISHRTQVSLNEKKFLFSILTGKLDSLSPLSILRRGYSILYSDKNKVLSNVDEVGVKTEITAQLTNGKLLCKVEKIIY